MAARTKFKTVDEYFSSLPANTRSIMVELRKEIKKIVPEAEEAISYNIPAFKFHGMLIWYAAFKEHVSLFPKTTAIKIFSKELAKYEVSKGTIQFPVNKPIPFGLITKIVKFRVKENLEQEKMKLKKRNNKFEGTI